MSDFTRERTWIESAILILTLSECLQNVSILEIILIMDVFVFESACRVGYFAFI